MSETGKAESPAPRSSVFSILANCISSQNMTTAPETTQQIPFEQNGRPIARSLASDESVAGTTIDDDAVVAGTDTENGTVRGTDIETETGLPTTATDTVDTTIPLGVTGTETETETEMTNEGSGTTTTTLSLTRGSEPKTRALVETVLQTESLIPGRISTKSPWIAWKAHL